MCSTDVGLGFSDYQNSVKEEFEFIAVDKGELGGNLYINYDTTAIIEFHPLDSRDESIEGPIDEQSLGKSFKPVRKRRTGYLLHCDKCNKILEKRDTIYVKNIPKKCEKCKSDLKYICKSCHCICINYNRVCVHIRHVCGGKLPANCCPSCDYKTYKPSDLKKHIQRRHKNSAISANTKIKKNISKLLKR